MTTAPARPDEAPSQRRVERRWTPVLAVGALILVVTAGAGPFVGGASDPDAAVVVGRLRVSPEQGWTVASSTAGPPAQALLRRGSAALLVTAVPDAGGSATALAQAYRDDVLEDRFAMLTVGEAAVDGPSRVGFSYVGITDEGGTLEGVVVVEIPAPGLGAVFDGFAPEGDLAWAIDDLGDMIEDTGVV